MHVEQSRIKLIKTEFESKLLFENPLINDASLNDLSEGFSQNIFDLYMKLPKSKCFVKKFDFKDSQVFWFCNGDFYCSSHTSFTNVLNSEIIIQLASSILELREPHYFSNHLLGDKSYDLLLIKEEDGIFGILKESLTYGVLLQLANVTSRVQELERKRLSLDLHDSVTQHLSGIKFLLSAFGNLNAKQNTIVQKCKEAIDTAILETRMVSRNLMPLRIEKNGFEIVLKELRERLELHYKIKMEIVNDSDFSRFSTRFNITIYRIIQELCSNSIKHGECSIIKLSFQNNETHLKFNYLDDGKGFDIKNYNKSRMGMSNIYFRIFQFNGECDIQSANQKGVNYYFTFPICKLEKV